MWLKVNITTKSITKSKKRFMAYSPEFGGYVFRCWIADVGFGCDSVQNMITGVTHYRSAKKQEKDRQLTDKELVELKAT